MVGPSVRDMLIDCDTCTVRGAGCADCVVSFLTFPTIPVRPVDLDDAEQDALGLLAESGLVPPLRLVRPDARTG